MTEVRFIGKSEQNGKREENRIIQGDYVYCEGIVSGVHNFWGIYNTFLGVVICLDGAGTSNVKGKEIYLGDVYNYWKVVKRIKCNDVRISIEDLSDEN